MSRLKVKKTGFYSWNAGNFAKGCTYCVKGEKLVLFVTGLCPARCDFCPVSDRKLYQDVVYANERPLDANKRKETEKGIIEEAKACNALGAGITGGDPLAVIKRTVSYIKLLKKTFGKKFHIHLYTPLNLVDKKKLTKLYNAGLDEIRFHLDLKTDFFWERLKIAKDFSWSVGVEIPVIPKREEMSLRMIDFIKDKVDFLNLNELELADNSVWRKKEEKEKVICKNNLSYAIMGSETLALKLLSYAAKKGICTHYCTCKLKDKVQLAKRIKRRAINTKNKFDIMTSEGMIERGSVYLSGFEPGFGSNKKILGIKDDDKKKLLRNLVLVSNFIVKSGIKKDSFAIDKNKLRIITGKKMIFEIKKQFEKKDNLFNLKFAIVKEYPTFDALELEVEFI